MADNFLEINGIALPVPSSMTQSDYDLTDSERNARGIMVMQMIREDIHKLECTWNILRPEEYMKIRKAIKQKYNLSTKYFIADLNDQGTIKTYAGDRTTPIYMYEDGDPNKPVYKGFKVNFIEM